MTTEIEKSGAGGKRGPNMLKHVELQLGKQLKATESQDKLLKELEDIERRRKEIRERQKAAKRDERLIQPSIEAGKGALAVRALFAALAAIKSAPLIKAIDGTLAAVKGAEADLIRQALGGEQLSCAAIAKWLDLPFGMAPVAQPAPNQDDQSEEARARSSN